MYKILLPALFEFDENHKNTKIDKISETPTKIVKYAMADNTNSNYNNQNNNSSIYDDESDIADSTPANGDTTAENATSYQNNNSSIYDDESNSFEATPQISAPPKLSTVHSPKKSSKRRAASAKQRAESRRNRDVHKTGRFEFQPKVFERMVRFLGVK